jgi:outer membrane receptor protein involved in Fe transport
MGWRWIDGTKNALWYFEEWDEGEDLAIKSVGDKQYVDLGASYVFSEHVSARLGVNNVFDSEPPNMSNSTFDNNTDTGLYDVFGRSYYLSLSMHY